MTDTCNHEPVQQLSASENEKWSCKKCGKPVPAPDTKGFVSPEELFKTVEKGRKMMQKPKDGWGEEFDRKYPHGVYHLHISNGRVTNEPDEKRERGICVPITDKIKTFIKEVESQAEQRGRDEREGELRHSVERLLDKEYLSDTSQEAKTSRSLIKYILRELFPEKQEIDK